MPRIENEMKAILRKNGNTTIKYDPHDSGFDQMLMGGIVRELKQYLDENLHKYLEVWYTQEGDNLRNKISHGWLEASRFDKRLADLLLYTLIRLSVV
jgi:hypothetical protein